jgi:hypothetical protein
MYYSSGVDGIFNYNPIHSVGGSLTKKMYDGKLIVRLMASDLFNTYEESGTSKLDGFAVRYADRYDYSSFRIALRYTFGKLKSPTVDDQSVSGDASDRVEQE